MKIDDLRAALHRRAGFEVVDASAGENQIRLVGRVPPNAGQQNILIIQRLLVTCETTPWKVDISRVYFVRGVNKKLLYAWRFIFQASGIEQHLQHIVETIQNTPRPARLELTEFPLTGTSPNRNRLVNGKGAGFVDKTPIGPMAAMQQRSNR